MRLRQLKMSGFKSFADSTLVEFPGNLAGIVGPNGCGKSNVIDAIRWVLGEGRISELRGSTSMSELIFSGSTGRPQSSRASVEMVLDNSDGSVQGPWGSYSEISVKRIVTRDGSNAYLINGQQVRRRDVQDIFMGTGLGPRSYAIISQGMISNFIKAKPEELRVYLEEAAGVSKYKERRRETETSLNSTRDNLQKVAYLQETKRVEIERLTGEAETAKKWREIEDERIEADQLSTYVQEIEAKNAIDKLDAKIAAKENERLANQGETMRMEAEIESLRVVAREKRDAVDRARQAKFEADKRVSEVEGNLRHIVDRKDSINHQLLSDGQTLGKRQTEREEALRRAEELAEQVVRLAEQAKTNEEEAEAIAETVDGFQNEYEDAHRAYEAARQASTEAESRLGILNVQIEAFDRELNDIEDRLEGLKGELEGTLAPDQGRFEELQAQKDDAQAELGELFSEIEENVAQLEEKRESLRALNDRKVHTEQTLARTSARLQTLTAIQEKSEHEGELPNWIEKMGFSGVKKLFERIEVDLKWVKAFEALLMDKSLALPLTRIDSAAGFVLDTPPARLSFYGEGSVCDSGESFDTAKLISFVKSDDRVAMGAIALWLKDVYVAEDLPSAMALQKKLKSHERLVTPEGHVVDAVSVSFWAEDGENDSILTRAAEIKKLSAYESKLRADAETLTTEVRVSTDSIATLEGVIKDRRSRTEMLRGKVHGLDVEYSRLQAQIEAWKQRSEQIHEDIESLSARREEVGAKREEAETWFETLDAQLSLKQQSVFEAQNVLEAAEHRVSDAEEELNEKRSGAKLLRMQSQSCEERSQDAKREAQNAADEIERIGVEMETLKAELATLDVQAEKDGLMEVTRLLETARVALLDAEAEGDAAENAVEEARDKRQKLQDSISPLLEEISEWKVKRQTWVTLGEALTAHLNEVGADRVALSVKVQTENLKVPSLKARVTRLTEQIAALGPVNHQALETLELARRAMQETENQVADLQEAIANLENTIKKIDAETRELLGNTFTVVNENFGKMFTGLFGGGSASLKMTGEEILETGIEVIAQPPGKRNASVKVLSGGEQALTATALVFAIFKLNPAPFCLLDEVDAPLDEANQDRLASSIGEMSEQTQFMMITHHRVTMEHLKQLIGVTMKEPGVSRVVAVDIAEAARIAQM